jgi:hypothetical protein
LGLYVVLGNCFVDFWLFGVGLCYTVGWGLWRVVGVVGGGVVIFLVLVVGVWLVGWWCGVFVWFCMLMFLGCCCVCVGCVIFGASCCGVVGCWVLLHIGVVVDI